MEQTGWDPGGQLGDFKGQFFHEFHGVYATDPQIVIVEKKSRGNGGTW